MLANTFGVAARYRLKLKDKTLIGILHYIEHGLL